VHRYLWVLLLWPLWGQAAEVHTLEVHYVDGALNVQLDAELNARVAALRSVLSDYRNLSLLMPVVQNSKVIAGAPPGWTRVHAELQGCIWIFCRDLDHVMDVKRDDNGRSLAKTVPGAGDFASGTIRWHLQAVGKYRSRLVLNAHLVPDIWVPPLIGPYLIERKVRHQFFLAVSRLERAGRRAQR
jgi:hypothetical protein